MLRTSTSRIAPLASPQRMAQHYVFLGPDTRGKGLSLPSWDSYFNPQKLKLSALAL